MTSEPPEGPTRDESASPVDPTGAGVSRSATVVDPRFVVDQSRSLAADPNLEAIAAATDHTLVGEVMAASGQHPASPEYAITRDGVIGLFTYLTKQSEAARQVDRLTVDSLIVELTERVGQQLDAILHHPTMQALESAWRGLRFVVERVAFEENILVHMLNVSKQDLYEDFQDSPEIPSSGLFALAYSEEYGKLGGQPYGLLVANYEFDYRPQDIALLGDCASIAAVAHAPFIASVGAGFFGCDALAELPGLTDLESLMEGPQYTKWRAFRDSGDSRYVGLCVSRFLLRKPYGREGNVVRAFEYHESVHQSVDHRVWGNAAFAFATRVADSFENFRWCAHLTGAVRGRVDPPALDNFQAMGRFQTKLPTEIRITERREAELAHEGLIPLSYRPEDGGLCFLSAASCQKPKTFSKSEEGHAASINERLGSRLPYLMITCRLAHYLKVIQRENVGEWKERQDLQRELQQWINQYVADMEAASLSVRARRPLRRAKVTVDEVAGNAGVYKVDLRVQPHFRFFGATFDLGVVGRIERDS